METLKDVGGLVIEPLSPKLLLKAQTLLSEVFPYCEQDDRLYKPDKSLEMVVKQSKKYFLDENLRREDYYVLFDPFSDVVVGTTGLSFYLQNSPHISWLGWFCINPLYRGYGLGKNLLNWTIKKAKDLSVTEMRIETSDQPFEVQAQELYESLGFTVYDTKPDFDKEHNVLYRRKFFL